MAEIRPGIIRIRQTKPNKIETLKKDVLREKVSMERDVNLKYERGKEAVEDLRDFASDVSEYIGVLKERGIDIDYIKENADQIRNIFFAVLELLDNGHKGFDEKTEKRKTN